MIYINPHQLIFLLISINGIILFTEASAAVKYECLLFDMDDTLYPASLGFSNASGRNIQAYMSTCLKIEKSEVPGMCWDLYREHGNTMAGLKALGYKFDNHEYHAFVHGTLPYHALKPDMLLRNLLLSMPQRKFIFTNADKAHADRVLSRMCLEDCFEGVICFETLNAHLQGQPDNGNDGPVNNSILRCRSETVAKVVEDGHTSVDPLSRIICKPSLESFQAAAIIANVNPNKTIFFDDNARNIATAKTAGFHTVIVGRSTLVPGADHALSNIHNIREALPELWKREGEPSEQVI